MCGRFALKTDLSALRKLFKIDAVTCVHEANFNIAPTNEVLAIIHRNGRRLGKLRWGLIPSGAKDPLKGVKFINARAETLETKPVFAQSFKMRRCLILADGFYEWERKNKKREPWFFTHPSGAPFLFAGIWSSWRKEGETPIHSCAIITTEASESVVRLHHRMPVILREEAFAPWLDAQNKDIKKLKEILEERVRSLVKYRVAPFVNSVKQNGPELIQPLKDFEASHGKPEKNNKEESQDF